MKFVVTKGYSNEVEVKLHHETKDKIKQIAYWTLIAVSSTSLYLNRDTFLKQKPYK